MTDYIDFLKKRRSIYKLGKNVTLSNNELTTLIQTVVRESPSAYNSQSSRVVLLFGEESDKLWRIVEDTLRPLTSEDNFPATKEKLAGFASGIGTILFFEDLDVVSNFQKKFPTYADNFPTWSEHSTAIVQHAVWVALATKDIGANLQHYNPIIDEAVHETWQLPTHWKLTAQMPFGSIEAKAGTKKYMDDDERFRIIN